MHFFSGFGFANEQDLFKGKLRGATDFSIASFSMGAISAISLTLEKIANKERVDALYLISPALISRDMDKEIAYFKRAKERYFRQFYTACFAKVPYILEGVEITPSAPISMIRQGEILDGFAAPDTLERLELLASYKFHSEPLKELSKRQIPIYMHIGLNDAIIDVDRALEFARASAAITYMYKDASHLLL